MRYDLGKVRMTVSQRYRGSTSCLDLDRGIVWLPKLQLKLYKTFRTSPTEIWHFESKAVYGLKCNILFRLVMKFLQTFKGSFHAQTMPITRSKQLVGGQEFARGMIHTSTNRSFKYWNYNLSEVRMTDLQHYRGSTSCLHLVMGIGCVRKPRLKVCKKFRTTPTKIWRLMSKAVYGLKWNVLARLVLKFLQTFKSSFRAQTMPLTRSKQLVGAAEFARGVIHASSKSQF